MLHLITLEVWFMRSLAENKTAKIRVSRVFDNREWVENDENRTKPVGRVTFRHFFYGAILRPAAVCAAVWARFAVCHARAAWRARYSSVTLAPRGEFVSSFCTLTPHGELVRHLSRSHRMASSFSSFFVFFLDRGRFCPFLTEKELLTMWPLLNSRKGSKRIRFHVHNRCQSKQVCRCRCSRSWSRRCLRRRLVV